MRNKMNLKQAKEGFKKLVKSQKLGLFVPQCGAVASHSPYGGDIKYNAFFYQLRSDDYRADSSSMPSANFFMFYPIGRNKELIDRFSQLTEGVEEASELLYEKKKEINERIDKNPERYWKLYGKKYGLGDNGGGVTKGLWLIGEDYLKDYIGNMHKRGGKIILDSGVDYSKDYLQISHSRYFVKEGEVEKFIEELPGIKDEAWDFDESYRNFFWHEPFYAFTLQGTTLLVQNYNPSKYYLGKLERDMYSVLEEGSFKLGLSGREDLERAEKMKKVILGK
ncbi:MAG: hypothetical protein ABIH72_04090 [archaeon]